VTFTLQELAIFAGGELRGGDPTERITGAASLAEAVPGEVTFYADPRYLERLRKTRASAIFVSNDFPEQTAAAQIRVANPSKAFEKVVLKLAPKPVEFSPGVHPSAVVDPTAKLGRGVSIQPHAVVESNATIGDKTVIGAGSYVGPESVIGPSCVIYPNVTIRERTLIGARVIVHSGAIIGADGFGFESIDGRYKKIPQIGIVQIDDDVEVGANTTIDRARFGRTWIQEGVKIDNLVQIAHNAIIGKNSIIAAQTGISGSTRIGENVKMAGQVGVIGHLTIGDNTIIAAQSGISKDLPGGAWFGSPAVPLPQAKRQIALIHRLGNLLDRIRAIEKRLGL
jgi:UDP-3-O-[3-hydroxymyristoyl] glucosamine N-acyltransferase